MRKTAAVNVLDKLGAAFFDNAAVHQNMHLVNLELFQNARVVRDDNAAVFLRMEPGNALGYNLDSIDV